MTYTQLCPRCEQPNRCGYSDNPEAKGCWCTQHKIPKPLLENMENDSGDTSCLCNTCLTELLEAFEKK